MPLLLHAILRRSKSTATGHAYADWDLPSRHMVDIYDIVPNTVPAPIQASSPDSLDSAPAQVPHAYAAQDTRYHRLLSKLSSSDALDTVAKVDWGTQDDDTIEMQQGVVLIKLEGGEDLVGNFADAAAAMR